MAVSPHRRVTLGAIAWVACVEFFVFQFITTAAASGYSIADHDISYLAFAACRTFTDEVTGQRMPPICSPLSLWFNISLVLLGALMVIGLVLTRPLWPRGKATKLGGVLYAVGGIGAMAAGTWTVETSIDVHMAGAMLNFLLGSAGMILLSFALRPQAPTLALIGLIIGAIAALGFMLYGAGLWLGLGRGGMERVGGYAAALWPVVMGAGILGRR
ncbi:DUF998 domain-containing protein [Devosia nitrariae]|uniref:DUF998 domain-containing protein n=1 Tax=Devosia nitrariae TaxID=2071872 RepID=A0ABQ5W119_9HYPH|nr:DUF998 domain-containing protein [Devosia nitrariae]GLQ53769.1 hypothetical protein GCM10010862_10280 [Devosia nitrariae]